MLGSTAVALAVAEGMVRIFRPHLRDQVVPAGMFTIDPALGWKLSPNKQVRHHTRYFDVGYSINSMGFRDRQREVSKPIDKDRLLFFGDSQIFGWGVPADDRISNVIEAQSASLEVWNMGVPGYGLDQEIIAYEHDGGSLGATGVILFVSAFTIDRTRSGFLFRKPKPRFIFDSSGSLVLVPPRENASAGTDLAYRLLSPFYLPYFVDGQLKRIRRRGRPSRASAERVPTSAEGLRLTEALLLRAKSIATARSHRILVLATLPPPSMKALKEFTDRNEIAIVPTPWTIAPPPLAFGPYDGHWNSRGHAAVAAQLSLGIYGRN